jgi:hypothetical protein
VLLRVLTAFWRRENHDVESAQGESPMDIDGPSVVPTHPHSAALERLGDEIA